LLTAAAEVSSSLDFPAAERKEELNVGAALELPPAAFFFFLLILILRFSGAFLMDSKEV
jgi:hypothetical protein